MPVIQDQVGLAVERILLATDFTPASEAAATYAKRLAKRFSSHLTIANVIDLSAATRSEEVLIGVPLQQMRHKSSELLDGLRHQMDAEKLKIRTQKLESRNPAEAIVDLATQWQANVIVMGTNARQGLDKAIVGSCAEGVIRHAPCPVMTIGPKAHGDPLRQLTFRTIVFATDFGPQAADKAALALAIAQDSMARIYLCHVSHNATEMPEALAEESRLRSELRKLIPTLAYDYCSPRFTVEHGDAPEKILELADTVGADLIVLGAKRSHTWFTHLTQGVVGKVLSETTCPVLTICAP